MPLKNIQRVRDIMIKGVFVAHPEDSIIDTAERMIKAGLDGMPVINDEGILVGLINQSNLISDKDYIHVPTLLKILDQFDMHRKDKKAVQDYLTEIHNLKVKDTMSTEPPVMHESESVDSALVQITRTGDIKPTSIIDTSRRLLGVITKHDIIKAVTGKEESHENKAAHVHVMDQRVGKFLKDFSRHFIFVSRWRTRIWLWTALTALLIGVLTAAFMILRISIGPV